MGCHMCWTEAYKLQRKKYKLDRGVRGEQVRKKANEPVIHICKTCGQPRNIRNEAQEVWNAKRTV
jgi:hypothetical protein